MTAPARIEQLCSQSGIGDFNALKAVYLLLALKLAEPGKLGSRGEKAAPRAAASEAPAAPEDRQAAEPPATRDAVQKAFAAMKGLNHFEILGVNATSTQAELKKSLFPACQDVSS